MDIRNVVIIGSGCSGHTAALYAARANLKPLVIEGHEPGGQLSITTLVENFPGFPEGIQGPELIENMRKQAQRFGAEYQLGHVTSADLSTRPFTLHVGKHQVHTNSLIIASGAMAWTATRTAADRPRRQLVCHLRWILFLRKGDCGGRRWRYCHGGSELSDALRDEGDDHPSPRQFSCIQNHAQPRQKARKDCLSHRYSGGRRL